MMIIQHNPNFIIKVGDQYPLNKNFSYIITKIISQSKPDNIRHYAETIVEYDIIEKFYPNPK